MEYLLIGSLLWCVLGISLASQRIGHRSAVAVNMAAQEGPVAFASAHTFCRKLFFGAFAVRFAIVLFFTATDAIRSLHLSPDSLKYHRVGMEIAEQMAAGNFNWPNWLDNGWYQFTGLVYYLIVPEPFLIQLVNITLGSLTPVLVYHLVARVYGHEQCARWTAIMVAFFPSFIYWSCLMLKDPVSIFAVCLLVLALVSLQQKFAVQWLFAILFSMLVFIGVREYLFFVCVFFILASFFPVEGQRTAMALVKLAVLVTLLGAATWAAGYGFLGMDYIQNSHYFDLDYINSSRVAIGDHGSGAFFANPDQALWGKDLMSTLRAAAAAVYFSLVSIDLTRLGSFRQLMALPEVLLTVCLLPSLFRGILYSWRNYRQKAMPLFVFAFGLLAVYGSAATNMGAMFRWRMQALPFLMAFIIVGLIVKGKGTLYRTFLRFLH